jgi:hypothetical protein
VLGVCQEFTTPVSGFRLKISDRTDIRKRQPGSCSSFSRYPPVVYNPFFCIDTLRYKVIMLWPLPPQATCISCNLHRLTGNRFR